MIHVTAKPLARAGHVMGFVVIFGLAIALVGCASERQVAQSIVGERQIASSIAGKRIAPSNDRLTWAVELGRRSQEPATRMHQPALMRKIKRAARGSEARALPRLTWSVELGVHSTQSAREVSDPALVRKVERLASASGARALNVTVLALSEGQHGPVVTLASADPASFMKHDLLGFLRKIEYWDEPEGFWFIELLDEDGSSAWYAGRFPFGGGMWNSRSDLWECSPPGWGNSIFSVTPPPPCPAD